MAKEEQISVLQALHDSVLEAQREVSPHLVVRVQPGPIYQKLVDKGFFLVHGDGLTEQQRAIGRTIGLPAPQVPS